MKGFFYDILIDPFTDRNWISYIMGVVIWVITILLTGLSLWLCIWLIDSSFLPLKEKEGVVKKHYYVPAHTTTTYVMSGKIMIPITNYINESYKIAVEIEGLRDDVYLCENDWYVIKDGDRFCFKYTNGRICKTLYIKSFCETNSIKKLIR